MTFPCPDAVRCPDSSNPLTNFSSEDPDPPIRIGYSTGTAPTTSFVHHGGAGPVYGQPQGPGPSDPPGPLVTPGADTGTGGDPPQLDTEWDNAIVTTFIEVTDPSQNPDDVAGNANVEQLVGNSGIPGEGGWRQPNGQQQSVFVNHPQTCTIFCSDGSPFSYTVPVGAFRAFTQAKADAAAYSFACKQAYLNRVCLGSISDRACIGTAYQQILIADAANIPVSFTVVSGAFPSWLTATVTPNAIRLQGTPTSADAGLSVFTIQAVDSLGFSMTKGYSITVMGATNAYLLTPATNGTAYSEQLVPAGGSAPYTFAFVSGSMPDGLSINDSGLISGTPAVAVAADYPFRISITDSGGSVCTQDFNIHVALAGICAAVVGSVVAGSRSPLANVGVRGGASNLMFCGSDAGATVTIVDTTTDTVAGSVGIGASTAAYGVFYVPPIGGAANPNDIIYVITAEGDLYTIDIDSFAAGLVDAQSCAVLSFQKPVYASTPRRLFYATIQGTPGPSNQPTATLWYYPITAGVVTAAYVDVDGAGDAALSVSHYVSTTNTIWFNSRDLGGLNSLNSMNASTLAVGGQILTSLARRSAQGMFCSGNNRFYVPCYPGGNILVGPWNLDVYSAAGGFIHSLALPSYCRGTVYDSTNNRIIALCQDRIRIFSTSDSFVCDLFVSIGFAGEFCPENARTYIANSGPVVEIIA